MNWYDYRGNSKFRKQADYDPGQLDALAQAREAYRERLEKANADMMDYVAWKQRNGTFDSKTPGMSRDTLKAALLGGLAGAGLGAGYGAFRDSPKTKRLAAGGALAGAALGGGAQYLKALGRRIRENRLTQETMNNDAEYQAYLASKQQQQQGL